MKFSFIFLISKKLVSYTHLILRSTLWKQNFQIPYIFLVQGKHNLLFMNQGEKYFFYVKLICRYQ